MHANNEIGTIQPIAELADLAHDRGALFHTDAVQSAGKIATDVKTLGVDLLAVSAHKFSGPKGVGALWIKRGTRMLPILTGGKHERNRRAGTENVAGLVGMGIAARAALDKLAARRRASPRSGTELEAGILSRVPGTAVNGCARSASRQYNEYQLRSRRGREPAHRARPRGCRRIDRIGLLVGDARAVPRSARHGVSCASDAEFASLQPRDRFRPQAEVARVLEVLPASGRKASRAQPSSGVR